MSENLKKKSNLWLLSFKVQTYLKGKSFSKEECLSAIQNLKEKTPIPLREKTKKPYKEIKEEPPIILEEKPTPLSWLDLPLYKKDPKSQTDIIIFVGKLEKENFTNRRTLTKEEEESLEKWMKAINVTSYAVKRFPWSENNLSLKYPEIESWFYKTLKDVNPKLIFMLGEENISLVTGYPVILDFIHGIEFPFQIKDISFPLLASYSPKDLSFNPHLKKQIWSDLKRLKGLVINL